MAYAVYTTQSFEEEISKLSETEKKIIRKIFLQLKDNPYVGNQIRYRFFREKRIKEKRIYYLIYDDLSAVLIVAFGGKKIQQKTIEEIIKYLPEFKKYLKNLLGGRG
jgi:mRNA-degrading endonuclease RelE of RelBE toxin-antitoxin system